MKNATTQLETPPRWFPLAPPREATTTPTIIIRRTVAEGDELARLRAEVVDLKARIRAQERALAYHRDRAARPLRECDRVSWLRAALCGHAAASPLPVLESMHSTLYTASPAGQISECRA